MPPDWVDNDNRNNCLCYVIHTIYNLTSQSSFVKLLVDNIFLILSLKRNNEIEKLGN